MSMKSACASSSVHSGLAIAPASTFHGVLFKSTVHALSGFFSLNTNDDPTLGGTSGCSSRYTFTAPNQSATLGSPAGAAAPPAAAAAPAGAAAGAAPPPA